MYSRVVICFGIVFAGLFNGYGQNPKIIQKNNESNFEKDYAQFLENQKAPYLNAIAEFYILEGTAWQRSYGEKEYVLTPTIQDISGYNKRIRQLDDKEHGIIKSKFHFLNVELTVLSKSLLQNINIRVPDYVQNNVNIYLPEIDIDILNRNDINYYILEDYGKKTGEIVNTKNGKTTIWEENWEYSYVPSTTYPNSCSGSVDCSWTDVDCFSHWGDWSVWCAGDGTDCNSWCDNYKNDMEANFYKNSFIDVSCYINKIFSFWVWIDTPSGSADRLKFYYSTGDDWNVVAEFPDDITSWSKKEYGLPENITDFNWYFRFLSDGYNNDDGAYIDDMKITGDELYLDVSPNSMYFDCNSGSENFYISANGDVYLEPGWPSWITVNVGGGNYSISVTENNTGSTRSGVLEFHVSDPSCENETLTIIQYGGNLSVSPTSKTVGCASGSYSVSVSSNVSWSVNESCSWVTISPSSGSGNGSFTVNYTENAGSTRSCTINISGDCGANATHTLTQTDGSLSISPTSKTVDCTSGSYSVNVSSNVNWSVSESCSWVTVSPSSGSNNGFFTVNYSENTGSTRPCTINITGDCGTSAQHYLTQNGPGSLSVSPTNKTVDCTSGSFSVSVYSSGSWSVSESCSWVTVSPSGGSGNGSFTVSYTENTGGTKTCTINLSGDCGTSATHTLTQNDGSLSISPTSKTVDCSSGSFSVNVSSNVSWSVSESCSWVTVSSSSGSDNGSFTVNYDAWPDGSERSCTISVSGDCGTYAQLDLTQDCEEYLDISDCPTSNVSKNSGSFTLNVNSNVSWNVSESCSWVTVSPSSGSNDDLITVSYTENTTSSSRTCTITVSGEGVSDQQCTFTQDDPNSINEATLSNSIKVYPNPATNTLNIIFEDNSYKNITINLLNVQGQIVSDIEKARLSSNILELDLAYLEDGIYYLNIQTDKGAIVRKISVMK